MDKVLEEGADWRLFFENGEFEEKKRKKVFIKTHPKKPKNGEFEEIFRKKAKKPIRKRQKVKDKVPFDPK